jgi:hypothetical protein
MAYELYYTAHFQNEQSQDVEIFIYKKDGATPDSVENYDVVGCEIVKSGEEQSVFNCLLTQELLLTLRTTDDKSVTWETFVDSQYDTWKIVVTIDGQNYFHGFVTPDEGNGPFQDKPYEVRISAVDGLALLKNVLLSDVNGDRFEGDHYLIEYIAGALKKTLLDLPIRIYCGVFHAVMQNKANSLDNDMFQQTKVNYRTFMVDDTTPVSCYEALKIIFNRWCTIEYWSGIWVISVIGERQYNPVDGRYNVDYNPDGTIIGGNLDTRNYGRIGKQMEIYPINETQIISSISGVSSVKTGYDYTVWPDLPKNARFERGAEFDSGAALDEDDFDNDGDTSEVIGTYRSFTIADTEYGKFTSANGTFPFIPISDPNDGIAYRKSVYNTFGIEIERKIVLTNNTGTNNYLLMEGIPVKSQSKIKISFDFKHTGGGVDFGSKGIIRIYLYPTGQTNDPLYILSTSNRWQDGIVNSYSYFYDNGEDSSKWKSFTIEPDFIPQDGTVYVLMENTGTGGDHEYRNFSIQYTPFIAGGYLQVKGDYWKRDNSSTFQQVIDEKVSLSDSPQFVFKGALLFNDQLTDPAWYRHGPESTPNVLSEFRHFKELLNIAIYNYHYRRMYRLEGDFNGLIWKPENDADVQRPIGFFWTYREVDMIEPRDFVLVPPLKMDIIKGWINANLVEVKKDSNDGTQEGAAEFKYIF